MMKKRRSSFGVAAAALNTKKKHRLSGHVKNPVLKSKSASLLESKSAVLSDETLPLSGSCHLKSKSLTLTKPVAPNLRLEQRRMKNNRQSVSAKSEDLLLEKIQKEKKEEQDRIEKAKKHYQLLKSNGFKDTTKSVPLPQKKVTIPKAPTSILDKRYGAKVSSAVKKETILVKKKPLVSTGIAHPTIPQPFQFATDKRLSSNTTESKVLTAGELAEKFMRDPRSHNIPEVVLSRVTTPHGPKLRTEIRSKSVKREKPISHEEIEQKLAEEQSKFVFKARVLDRRIFESRGEFGVPKVAVKPPTIPVDIELRTEKRASSPRAARPNQITEDFQTPAFKARPIPSTIKVAEKIKTPPSKTNFRPTIAVSPKLHGTSHASAAPARRQRMSHAENDKKLKEQKSRQSFACKVTQPQEFRFETAARGQAYRAQLEEQLKLKQAEEARAMVKANPVPDFSKAFQPKIIHKEPTVPEPFSLMSIHLHEESLMEFQREVEEERRREREASTIKAKSVPKTLYEPALPAKVEEVKVTVPVGMKLESNQRAKKRQEFDEEMSKKMEQLENLQLEMEKKKEDQENKMLKELRRKSVEEGGLMFKAKPILKEDPFPVKSVAKAFEPTIPKSPKFILKERRSATNEICSTEDNQKTKFAAALRNL